MDEAVFEIIEKIQYYTKKMEDNPKYAETWEAILKDYVQISLDRAHLEGYKEGVLGK